MAAEVSATLPPLVTAPVVDPGKPKGPRQDMKESYVPSKDSFKKQKRPPDPEDFTISYEIKF